MSIIERYFIVSLFILIMLVSFLIRSYNYALGSLFAFSSFVIVYRESFKLFQVVEDESNRCK